MKRGFEIEIDIVSWDFDHDFDFEVMLGIKVPTVLSMGKDQPVEGRGRRFERAVG